MSDPVLRFPDRVRDELEGLPQPLRNAAHKAIFHLLEEPVPALADPFPKQIRCQVLGLGQAIGRQIAHEVVYDAARVEDTTFTEAIKRDPRVTAHLDAATIDRLLDLASHTGLPADIARAAAQRARATADGITAGR